MDWCRLLSGVLACALVCHVHDAHADCAPDPANAGDTITCTDVDADGFVVGVTDLSIAVDGAATVLSANLADPNVALSLLDGSRLDNAGTVQNDGALFSTNVALQLAGSATTLVNTGTISAMLFDFALTADPTRNTVAVIGTLIDAAGALGGVEVVNRGILSVQHIGVGDAAAIHIGDDVDDVTIDNGLPDFSVNAVISFSRFAGLTDIDGNPLALSLAAGGAGELVATNPLTGATEALGVNGAIVTSAGPGRVVVRNDGGLISSDDFITPVFWFRNADASLINSNGFISNSGFDLPSGHAGLLLAASGSGSIDIELGGDSDLGGDVVIGDVHPVRWWAQEALGIGGLDLVASETGIRNSSLRGRRSIFGDVLLGSGTHDWQFVSENFVGVGGRVTVDQRNLSASPTPGAATFAITAATLSGGVTINDVPGAVNRIRVFGGGNIGDLLALTGDGDNEVSFAETIDNTNGEIIGAINANIDGFDRLTLENDAIWALNAGFTQIVASTRLRPLSDLQVDSTLVSPIVDVAPTAILRGAGTIEGNVTSAGSVKPGFFDGNRIRQLDTTRNRLTITGALDLAPGATIEVTVFGPGGTVDEPGDNVSQVFVGATGTLTGDVTIVPTIMGTKIRNREAFRVMRNTNGGAVFDALPAVGVADSALLDWQLYTNDGGDLAIVAVPGNLDLLPWRSGGGRGAAEALLAYTGSDPGLFDLAGELQAIVDPAQVAAAAETLRPERHNASVFAALDLFDRFASGATRRLDDVVGGSAAPVAASTDSAWHGVRSWTEGFGTRGEQRTREGADGFEFDGGGMLLGADTRVGAAADVTLGIAVGYGFGDVDHQGLNRSTRTSLDTYHGLAYASWDLPHAYVRGLAGAGLLRYDTERVVSVGAFSDANAAWHDGLLAGLRIEGGLPLRWRADWTLTPFAQLQAAHVAQDGYVEATNLGRVGRRNRLTEERLPDLVTAGAALRIGGDDATSLRSALGLRAHWTLDDGTHGDGELSLDLSAAWRHEFANPTYDTSAQFLAGDSPGFHTSGISPARDAATLGAGVHVAEGPHRLGLRYAADFADRWLAQSGMLEYRYAFGLGGGLADFASITRRLGGGGLPGLLCVICGAALTPDEAIFVYGRRVRAPGPLPGLQLDEDQLPANVQSLDSDEIRQSRIATLGELLGSRMQSININDYQGNPFQVDVSFRGFTASPQIGTPQGLSVFFDGIRVNEPFGDVVNWDLVPLNAIASADLFPGSNPLFGLNTLGGALSLRTRNGFDDKGVTVSMEGGSWGRKHGQLSAGWSLGPLAGFVAITGFHEDGWRDNSPTLVQQAFTRLDLRGERASGTFTMLVAGNDLIGNGMTPRTLYEEDPEAVFTSPDRTENDALQFALSGAFDVTDLFNVTGQIYRRDSDRASEGGDIYDDFEDIESTRFDFPVEIDAAANAGFPLCRYPDVNGDDINDWGIDMDFDGIVDPGTINRRPTEDEVAQDQFQFLEPLNGPVLFDPANTPPNTPGCVLQTYRRVGEFRRGAADRPGNPDGTPIGVVNRLAIGQDVKGGALQLNLNHRLHHLMLGASVDHARATFLSRQQLANIDRERNVFLDPGIDPIYDVAYDPLTNNEFEGFSNTESAYFSETFSPSERLHLTLAGRYNFTRVKTSLTARNRSGGDEANRVSLHNFRNFDSRPDFILCDGDTLGSCPNIANRSFFGVDSDLGDKLQLPGFTPDDRRNLIPTRDKHRYHSFNPSLGINVLPRPHLNLFANWSQGTRTPSVVELGCAYDGTFVDPDDDPTTENRLFPRSILDSTIACTLPTALSGDPFLPQIFARTIEIGARGRLAPGWDWNASVYRTKLKDDIYLVGINSFSSFFDTLGKTQREGLELGFGGHVGRFDFRVNYGYNEATFQSRQFLLAERNSRALRSDQIGVGFGIVDDPIFGGFDPATGRPLRQEVGMIVVEPGDRMPGMPLHNVNATLDRHVTARWDLGITMTAHSGVYLRGNENNEHRAGDRYQVFAPGNNRIVTATRLYDNAGEVGGYAVFRLTSSYELGKGFRAFGQVNNLFDEDYFSGGRLGINPFSPSTNGAIGDSGWNYNVDEWQHASFVAPGAPRAVWVGVEYRF